MTNLERLHAEYGQSPWLDNLTRGYLRDGTLARMVADGIRGVTATAAGLIGVAGRSSGGQRGGRASAAGFWATPAAAGAAG